MKKFDRKKVAIALACASILGGKSSTTLYPQTVEAVGRSTKSSGEKFINWVKNHKWPVIGGASAIATVAVVTTVLGVKYLGKKDQKNPDKQESKIDGEDNKQSQVPGENKEAGVKKDDGKNIDKGNDKNKDKDIIEANEKKGEFFENNQEMIKNIECKDDKIKNEIIGNLKKLKEKLKVWTKDPKQLENDLTVADTDGIFSTSEGAGKQYVGEGLNNLFDIFSGKIKWWGITQSIDDFGRYIINFSSTNFIQPTLTFAHQESGDTFILKFNKGFSRVDLRFKF